MSDQFWKPTKSEKAAISRGDRKHKEYTERTGRELEEARRKKREAKPE